MRKGIAAMAAAGALLGSVASGQAVAETTAPSTLVLTASVVDQECQPNGDFVDVTLTATAESSSRVRAYRWDFTNDGSWDTGNLSNPMVVHTYPDEVSVTARVGAVNRERDRATDTVTFGTLRCP